MQNWGGAIIRWWNRMAMVLGFGQVSFFDVRSFVFGQIRKQIRPLVIEWSEKQPPSGTGGGIEDERNELFFERDVVIDAVVARIHRIQQKTELFVKRRTKYARDNRRHVVVNRRARPWFSESNSGPSVAVCRHVLCAPRDRYIENYRRRFREKRVRRPVNCAGRRRAGKKKEIPLGN